jgi:uncharacterized membrane protein
MIKSFTCKRNNKSKWYICLLVKPMMKNCSISVLGQQLTKENALVRFALRTVPHKEIGLAHQTSIVFHKSKVASFMLTGCTYNNIYLIYTFTLPMHYKLYTVWVKILLSVVEYHIWYVFWNLISVILPVI